MIKFKLIVKGRDWYANLPITKVVKEENTVFAYYDDTFIGFFDLGAVDVLYISEEREKHDR